MPHPDDYLDPVAVVGSPAEAFATHKARANGIAKYFAVTRPLSSVTGQADENTTVALIAHLHAALSGDPDFADADGARAALRGLSRGAGLVGTDGASTKRDYDMAVKGLMTIAYRYRGLLRDEDFDFVLDGLVPPTLRGGHPPSIEIVEQSFLEVDTPETENHLLMIESSRYLTNQLLRVRTGDAAFDNNANGLTSWLLGFMQNIARHEFMEFNARPYARMSLHSLLNLHEFAQDAAITTAAQILLDYTMVKFAVSSSRGRRVGPFRRHQHQINHQANVLDDLYAEGGDQVAGMFLAATGAVGPDHKPAPFPASLAFTGLLGATAAYRPPAAAYTLALASSVPGYLHRFFHGKRPVYPAAEPADPGVELYYRSPSFLLTAGGSFLNSGYGLDEVDIASKHAWVETSRAQAATLLPARLDVAFHDLVRFDPYPDSMVDPFFGHPDGEGFHTSAVNSGVSRGLAAGANLRPAEKKTVFEQASSTGPALATHDGWARLAWKGSGNHDISVAAVQATTLLGIDGVEGVQGRVILDADSKTDATPALASHDGRLFVAWRGSGNPQLNLAFSEDGGATYRGRTTLADSSDHAPALASHGGRLFLAWTGRGNDKLNIAKVSLFASTAGAFGIEGLEEHVVLDDSSDQAPAVASHADRLYLAWKGSGNDNLNLAASADGGATFATRRTLSELSANGPALASHAGRLFLAWRGSGNEQLNVAAVVLIGDTAGGFGIEGVEAKSVLSDFSPEAPALTSANDLLILAWKGEGDGNLNLRISRDGTFAPALGWTFADRSGAGFFLAAYRTLPARQPDDPDVFLDTLGMVYATEADGIDFETFKARIRERNADLPAQLEYGATYQFTAPDDKRFSVWFGMTGDKYKARVIDLDDPVSDLTTLPLVGGEYLRAPGGHDGLIEIFDPACGQTPIVLDFRGPVPTRTDDVGACPQPWIDRAQALIDAATRFRDLGATEDAQTALTDAVAAWEALASTASWVRVAAALSRIASLMTTVDRTAEAVTTQQQVLDLLTGLRPSAAERREWLIELAEARHNLLVRLDDDQRFADVTAGAPETVEAYRAYVADAGGAADTSRLENDLTPLQRLLSAPALGVATDAVDAIQLLVDAYATVPLPTDHLDFDFRFAAARHNLVARLLDAKRPDDASQQSQKAITAYVDYAAEPGADPARAAAELVELARVLEHGGLASQAQAARDAATSLGA